MSDKLAEYRLSPQARDDLEEIWVYTLRKWGLKQANRYAAEITTAFAALAEQPQMAGRCDHIRAGYRRFKVGRHTIYFRIAEYGIEVTRILHERMLHIRHLQE